MREIGDLRLQEGGCLQCLHPFRAFPDSEKLSIFVS